MRRARRHRGRSGRSAGERLCVCDRTDQAVRVLQQAIGRIGQADPQLGLQLEGASALAGIVDDRTAAAANRSVEVLRARLDDMPDAPVRLLVAAAEAAMRRAEPGDAAEQMIKRALARQPDPPLKVCTSIIVTLMGVESFGALRQLCEDMMTAARRRAALQEMIGIASSPPGSTGWRASRRRGASPVAGERATASMPSIR